ncbi:hypothetical protein [Pimelobacter simplex]|uniref:hypothetical protein n=1 Tax=Nocardioides simplex TaxID=2045 RepID=UPI0019318EBC|nr:hypothetical protein [Pimelobacter simplex]
MVHLAPIGTIKHLARTALHTPAAVAGAVVGVAQTATRRVRGTASAQDQPAQPPEEQPGEHGVEISPDQPVNVTEALGLDPAPVAKPRARTTPAPPPVTSIDAQADPGAVSATPADVADVVDED